MAGIGCHYMAVWMDRSTVSFTRWAAKACPGSARRRSRPSTHIFANLGDGTYFHSGLLAIRQAHRRRRQHHLQDPLQRRGRDDRRPAGRRHAERCREMTRELDAEGATQGRRRHRRAREVRRRATAPGARRHRAPPRRARRDAARVARDPGLHGHHLRPDLRHREAPPPQARHDGRPGQARRHQRAGVRRLRRLLACRATACRSSRWRPSSAASAASTRTPATRTIRCLKGFCPSFVTVEGGQLKKHEEGRRSGPTRPTLPRAARAGAAGSPRQRLGHRRRRRRRHRRHHHRPAARHGRAPRRQGHRHAGRGRPGAKGRRHLEPRPDRQPRRTRSAPPGSAPPRPTW